MAYWLAASHGLFKRVKNPRFIFKGTANVPNVSLEVFETSWKQEGWLPLVCRQARPFTRRRYAVVDWEEVQSFANFQVLAAALPI